MFQFPGLALSRSDGVSPARFPHSDTPGSMLACSSPRLIAACHVLHRRLVPRHPPCALLHLTSTNCWSRIKKHAQNDARIFFTQSPRLPRISKTATRCLRPSLTNPCCQEAAAPAGEQPGRSCCISIRVPRKQAGRLSSAFRLTRGQLTRHLQKGGDPAAGSPTATLLRLRPSYRSCLRPLLPEG